MGIRENPMPPPGSSEPTLTTSVTAIRGASAARAVAAAPARVLPGLGGEDHAAEFPPEQMDCQRCQESLTTAAHDLKTPLAILSGYIELMLSGKLGPLSPPQRNALQEMNEHGQRLSGFVKNFLALRTFRDTSVELQLASANLNACLADIVQVWSPNFQRKRVALFFAPDEQLQPFPFDYCKVQHVLSNLLENALKFCSTGGTVWITAELHLWERRTRQQPAPSAIERRRNPPSLPNTVRVTVGDSGPGIAPEFHQEIFQEYFRVDHATEGHGLGLAIAQRLVTRFGGKIWVESEPGMGAKFSFLLPLKPTG